MIEAADAPWRLIHSPPAVGAANMALDEALLAACAARPESFPPTLRLYTFQPACLSLGHFQATSAIDFDACLARGVEIVRRPSGGRAVLHDRCLTYALVAPLTSAPFAGSVPASVERIGAALAHGLHQLGAPVTMAGGRRPATGGRPAACFAVTGVGEISGERGKLAGSAQVRRGAAALQHGTIRLQTDAGDIRPLLRAGATAGQTDALDRVLGRPVSAAEVGAALLTGVAQTFGIGFTPAGPTREECERAEALFRAWPPPPAPPPSAGG